MQRLPVVVFAIAPLALVAVVAACSSSTPATSTGSTKGSSSGSSGDDGSSGTTPPATPPSTGSSSGSSGSSGSLGATCGAKTSANDCFDCCYNADTASGDAYDNAYFGCLCDTPGTCKTQCATTDCSMSPDAGQPDTTCTSCEDTNDQACDTAAVTKCGSSTCKTFIDCTNDAKCLSKN